MLIDSHAHIDMSPFDQDREDVIARARKAGVTAIITVGCDLESSEAAVALASRYDEVYAAIGFHPHSAAEMKADDVEKLARLAQQPKVVAVGEIGLDFYRNLSPRDAQQKAFQSQLDLAQRLSLPVIVHSRNAKQEVQGILREWASGVKRDKLLGVLHCFSGDFQEANTYIEMGFLVSIAGPITYRSSAAVEVASNMPLEKLLIETDCPFLTPHPYRGKRNEPSYLPLVVNRIAQIRGLTSEAVAEQTARNTIELFRLGRRVKGAS